MRGSDTVHEQLFSFSRLEDLIPANHPLRVIRTWVNAALVQMNDMLDQMYAADHKGVAEHRAREAHTGDALAGAL